ncbi:MAG: ABC transporter ATP-binding protein [Planctomycetaceae bacterium]|mgnify:FL=1|nr:ABC transporter ATP-binding protein [Planctomycetaceae bacterium]HRJ78467.1 ABC transporter ATP-binding protein [Planctomycetota bacterium]
MAGQVNIDLPRPRGEGQLRSEGPVIKVEHLTKRYGDKVVLDDISFELARGRVYVIMGPSGCGKSTLLRMMIGAEPPDAGRVLLDGVDITTADKRTREEARRKFGVLFQSSALLNGLTVAENVALPIAQHTDLLRSTIDLMVRLKLELVGMGDAADKFPYEVSGGMKKRAGLARAIALDPAIVFYDEPSAGLDPVMVGVIDKLIKDLTSKLGITSVVITHEMPSIFRIADEVIMLYGGKIVFQGSPGALRSSTSPLVRQFINGDPEGPLNAPRQLAELSQRLFGSGRTPAGGAS